MNEQYLCLIYNELYREKYITKVWWYDRDRRINIDEMFVSLKYDLFTVILMI